MPFAALIVGAILIVVAYNNTQGALAIALEQDLPGYFKWAAAIAALMGLGYVPGLREPSRWLLALVALVVFLTNYQQIFNGFTNFAQSGGASTASGGGVASPSLAYATNPASGALPTQQEIAGAGSTAGASTPNASMIASTAQTAASNPASLLSPSTYLAAFGASSAGFGGLTL